MDVRIKYKVDKGELVIARNELAKINKELGVTEKQSKGLSTGMKAVGGAIIAAFTIDKLVDFGRQVITITAEFQKLRSVLTNTLGSKSAADTALKNIQDFAAKTPFSVAQLTASFVKLANQGFVPTTNELRKLGDLASSTGKEFDQLTEAIIDAQTGEFERLKEFGIRAAKEGDKVTFTFKGVKTQTDFTNESIRAYILSLGDLQGVSGSMAAISKTLEGQISNINDSIDTLLTNVGTGLNPAISGAISVFGGFINTLNNLVAVPVVEKLKSEQLELNTLVGAITHSNTSNEARSALLTELNQKYPDFLKNLNLEKVTNEQLTQRIEDVNNQFLRKIALQEAEDRFRDQQDAILDSIDKEVELRKANAASIQFVNEQKAKGMLSIRNEETTLAVIQKREREIKEIQEERTDIQADLTEKLQTYTSALDLFNSSSNDYFQTTTQNVAVTDKLTAALINLSSQYKLTSIDVIRNAQEQLDALGGQSEASFSEIEEFILKTGEAEQKYYDDSAKLAEEDLKTYEENYKTKAEADKALKDLQIKNAFELASSLSQIFGRQSGVAKTAALFAIALDTAQAISALTRNSEANPANAVTFGLAGVTQFVTGLARITANIASAKKIIGGAKRPDGFARGVLDLQGPGTGTSDSIPARLSRGESVMTTAETRNFMPTLRAIRENRIDPELLNAVSEGKAKPTVFNQVIEVPRDDFSWDEDGFTRYMRRKNIIIEEKTRRYKC